MIIMPKIHMDSNYMQGQIQKLGGGGGRTFFE